MSAATYFPFPRKRRSGSATSGERAWAKGETFLTAPVGPTLFEGEIDRLGLAGRPEEWPHSKMLRKWAERNRERRYVPESLLREWGLEIDDWEVNVA